MHDPFFISHAQQLGFLKKGDVDLTKLSDEQAAIVDKAWRKHMKTEWGLVD
jgi:hypothetical protein